MSDVEPNGFAWEAGLRTGSRLVEICKVASTTLTHEQMIDLLRTTATVRVIAIPPLVDGRPRRYASSTVTYTFSQIPLAVDVNWT